MIIQCEIKPGIDQLMRQIKGDVQGAHRAGMINTLSDIEGRARKYAPVKRSNLANSGTSSLEKNDTVGIVTFTAPYSLYVHEGTGLYGPHKTKIIPKGKKALFWPGAAHPVKSVRGMKGRPFLLKAAQDTDIARSYTEGANNYLARKGGG